MKKLIIIIVLIFLIFIVAVYAQPITPSGTYFFRMLHDTPSTYTDQSGYGLKVNSSEDALEFFSWANSITLGTDTTGNYVATIAGNSVITVTGSGSETANVTLDIADGVITEADLKAVDSATDEDILTYESTTGDYEWHTIVQMLAITDTDSLSEGSTNLYQDSEVTGWIDDVTLGSSGALTIPTGQAFIIGTTTWTSSDEIDGTKIKDADYGDVVIDAGGDWNVVNAETLTITDNENTAENNPLVFVAGGDLDGGNLGLETDGDAHYNPSTGTITATEFVGGGAGLTGLTTLTEEEVEDFVGGMLGGTETDISVTYQDATNDIDFVVTSLVDIVTTSPLTVNAGANLDDVIVGGDADITFAITVLKDLVTTAPVTGGTNDIFPGSDADITVALDFTAAWDYGGAASLELPNSAAPTTDAAGEIALDTTITDHQPLYQYYDGGENMTIIAIDTAQLPAEDNEAIIYDAASDKFVLEAQAGAAGGDAWSDAVDSDILPTGNDDTYDIGAADAQFKDGYFDGTLEADILTEGGNAVWNATETEIIDSDHYVDGSIDAAHLAADVIDETKIADNGIDSEHYNDASIDHEHLAPDVISGMTDVTSEDADYMLIWDNTDSALKKVDMGEVRGAGGGATAWDDIADPDAAATVDFVTYTQTIDIGKSDSGGGSGLILDLTGLGNGTDDVIGLEITTATDWDEDYVPIAIFNNSGADNDLIFEIDYRGSIQLKEGGRISNITANQLQFSENSDSLIMLFGGTDCDLVWSDGALNIRNSEGGVDGIVNIQGTDAGEKGILRVMSDGDDKYIELHHDDSDAQILSSSGDIYFTSAGGDINFNDDNTTTTGSATAASMILTGADANPDAAGEIQYDSAIAGIMAGGGLRWFDDDSVRLIVDLETDPSDDDYVVAYDSTADGFYMKADADTGGATAWDDIGDADAAGTIDFTTHTQTIDIGVTDDGGGSGLILDVTGLTAGTDDVIALEITTLTDDDTNYIPIAVYDDSGGDNDLLFYINSAGGIYSAGVITANSFSGLGSSLTSVDAATGDSATAFFDAGTIEHEWGGLQADISGYTGLIGITGADTTVEVDSKSELETHIADVADFAEADGDTWTGVHDFSGVTTTVPWKVNATAAPTVEGQAIWESDTDELTVGDGAASIVVAAKTNTVFCFNIHDIDSGMDDIKMPFTRATIITKVTAFVTAGTNVVGRLYEVDGDGDDADAVGVESSDWTFTAGETEDVSFNNATFDAGDYIQWDTTSVSGSVTGFMISVEGYEI